MNDRLTYAPGPARGAQVRKGEELWTLVLVRELRHSPEKVWAALIDPAQLREWAPFEVDGKLDKAGNTVNLTWVGTGATHPATVTRAEAPELLEFANIRWELEEYGSGTRLTLWTNIDRRFVAWGAAGWHIAFDVLDRLIAGNPIGRLAGGDAMKMEAWQRLTEEYAAQFGMENPSWKPAPPKREA